jgi:hypothetical protein
MREVKLHRVVICAACGGLPPRGCKPRGGTKVVFCSNRCAEKAKGVTAAFDRAWPELAEARRRLATHQSHVESSEPSGATSE